MTCQPIYLLTRCCDDTSFKQLYDASISSKTLQDYIWTHDNVIYFKKGIGDEDQRCEAAAKAPYGSSTWNTFMRDAALAHVLYSFCKMEIYSIQLKKNLI